MDTRYILDIAWIYRLYRTLSKENYEEFKGVYDSTYAVQHNTCFQI